MQIPAYDPTRAYWDKYKRFHNLHRRLTVFDSGDAFMCDTSYDPSERSHRNRETNTRAWSSTDPAESLPCNLYTPDGEKVLKSHLLNLVKEGSTEAQLLLIDYDTNTATNISHAWAWRNSHEPELPGRADGGEGVDMTAFLTLRQRKPAWMAERGYVYIAGNGAQPIGTAVRVVRPMKLTREEKAEFQNLLDACKAWVNLKGYERRSIGSRVFVSDSAPDVQVDSTLPAHIRDVLGVSFSELTEEHRLRLNFFGYNTSVMSYVTHLVVEPTGE